MKFHADRAKNIGRRYFSIYPSDVGLACFNCLVFYFSPFNGFHFLPCSITCLPMKEISSSHPFPGKRPMLTQRNLIQLYPTRGHVVLTMLGRVSHQPPPWRGCSPVCNCPTWQNQLSLFLLPFTAFLFTTKLFVCSKVMNEVIPINGDEDFRFAMSSSPIQNGYDFHNISKALRTSQPAESCCVCMNA